jgi:hypothetical protein
MWKHESPEVLAYYEQLSQQKKNEHFALYPNYRFQPMKKADKDRIRAEKLAKKEQARGAPKMRRGKVSGVQPLFTMETPFGPTEPSQLLTTPRCLEGGPSLPTPPGDHSPQFADHSLHSLPFDNHTLPLDNHLALFNNHSPAASTLVVPHPGMPEHQPSATDWQSQMEQQWQVEEFNSLWCDTSSQLTLPEATTSTVGYCDSSLFLTLIL